MLAETCERKSMSTRIFQIPWTKYFPLEFERKGCVAEYVTPAEGFAFIQDHYKVIHELDQSEGNSFSEDYTDAKLRYYQEEGDFFLVKEEGIAVGIIVGSSLDWSSYNLRNSSFLPRLQGSGLHSKLLSYLIRILAEHGVVRAEADVSPSNFASLQVLIRARFNVTGMNLSERWGALVHMTQYLQADAEGRFLERFCIGPKPQLGRLAFLKERSGFL